MADFNLTGLHNYGLTLKWTDNPDRAKNVDFVSMINELNQYKDRNVS